MRRLLLVFLLFALGAAGGGYWLAQDFRRFLDTPLALTQDQCYYVVEPGASVRSLAFDLHRRGWLDRPYYLIALARLEDKAHRLQAGEYLVRAGVTAPRFLDQIIAGRVAQHALTLVEGWTFRAVRGALANNGRVVHTLDILSDEEVMDVLGHAGEDPEGRFFPDTYYFPAGTSDVALLKRAYRAMSARLQREWAERAPDLPYSTPYQALIMASIVEKETALPEERPAVAGVFVRRLERGMPLQTDPTVIYGLGDAFDGNLRRSDLDKDTPYNTYLHRGLPPGPIAIPGIDALRAALHPASGDALYFVARGDGGHKFSATLEEHNRAVRRYQLNGR